MFLDVILDPTLSLNDLITLMVVKRELRKQPAKAVGCRVDLVPLLSSYWHYRQQHGDDPTYVLMDPCGNYEFSSIEQDEDVSVKMEGSRVTKLTVKETSLDAIMFSLKI